MKALFTLLVSISSVFGFSQTYWQQKVDMKIRVKLNDTLHSLTGDVEMAYKNNSPDTLTYIWIHLWPNAYKNDRTAFSEQLLEQGRTDFYFSREKDKGYINQLDFKVNEKPARTEDHPEHQDIIKLLLPETLPPGKSVAIKTPFHLKLPLYFSRSGHIGQSYQLTQWFPKPAVYDRKGWHPIPYLDQGEFYSEFGDYEVEITVPQKYVVAATGELFNETIKDSFSIQLYKQNNIHDFAWFADKNFEKETSTLSLNGREIKLALYYNRSNKASWKNALDVIKHAVELRSEAIGEYPYNIVSVVEVTKPGGGMEYPTITLISNLGNTLSRDEIIHHEIGHNWFYGILASNERSHPWMDEGMNRYYDYKWHDSLKLRFASKSKDRVTNFSRRNWEDAILLQLYRTKTDQPIETPAQVFNSINYNAIAYGKAGRWMELLEQTLGSEKFSTLMKRYYEEWKFRHPYPEDFKALAEKIHGDSLTFIFDLLYKKGDLIPQRKKKLALMPLMQIDGKGNTSAISIAPAIGYNAYDKFQAGLMLHNYNLPLPSLRFLLAPLYGIGSKSFNGIGRAGYNHYFGKGRKIELFVSASKFNMSSFSAENSKTRFLSFTKIVPGAEYTFGKKPTSTIHRSIRFKYFDINEDQLNFKRDTVSNTFTPSYSQNRGYVNQLELTIENTRKLYPYSVSLQAEQGKGFIKTRLTGNYFYNYAGGGGLQVRAFAGKFFYTISQTVSNRFSLSRYHLNMTGPNGYEDYTYSSYFAGRNEFEGFASQQIAIQDGAFKVRTDLLSTKAGRSDDWLAALNFSSSIPKEINPLSVLPVQLPLKVFADIGTHAEAWKKGNVNGRFLYDAGIQLSLFNFLNFYYPILYSKVYDDYYKTVITENKFRSRISFSIDFQNISPKKLFPQLNL